MLMPSVAAVARARVLAGLASGSGQNPNPSRTLACPLPPGADMVGQRGPWGQGRSSCLGRRPLRYRNDIAGWQERYGAPFSLRGSWSHPTIRTACRLTRSKTWEIEITTKVCLGNSISSVDFDFRNLYNGPPEMFLRAQRHYPLIIARPQHRVDYRALVVATFFLEGGAINLIEKSPITTKAYRLRVYRLCPQPRPVIVRWSTLFRPGLVRDNSVLASTRGRLPASSGLPTNSPR